MCVGGREGEGERECEREGGARYLGIVCISGL